MASVRLEEVQKIYSEKGRDHVAVHECSFTIADGEFVVLVGPSGCGKSTTLRMIAGLESISAGRLFIGERLVNDLPPKDRNIAMVFQSYALYPHMTVAQNLGFALKLQGLSASSVDTRVRQAAEMLGISHLIDRKPRQLSGGERQRVALGRALVRQPQVFLFDEPLSNLDAKLRVHMRREIARLHRQLGTTMIYVTHDQVEAMTLGERIVVLNGGRVQQIGTPLEIYQTPFNTFVAGFLGSPPMNLFHGEIDPAGGPRFLLRGGGPALALPAIWAASGSRPGPAVLGIRPENVQLVTDDSRPEGEEGHPFRVEVVEPLGNETLLFARAGDQAVTARVGPGLAPKPGSEVHLVFRRDAIHLFDAESGLRLAPSTG